MKKILVTTSAALFAAVAMASFSAPANAGSFSFNIGVGGFGPGWYGPGWGGVYVGGPYYNSNAYALHVDWCFDHKGPTYNPDDNTYINGNGKVKYCNSPYT
jgi:hypothetical protein